MKKLNLDVTNLKNNIIRYSLDVKLVIELLFNHYDNYIYLAILDDKGEYLLGHSRLVPNINYFRMNRIDVEYDLVCVKINESAQEKDLITIDNLNKDYSFFLIERSED